MTCLNARNMALQREFAPRMDPSAYWSPRDRTAGWRFGLVDEDSCIPKKSLIFLWSVLMCCFVL